jgi:hypothetical protein
MSRTLLRIVGAMIALVAMSQRATTQSPAEPVGQLRTARDSNKVITINREVFQYSADGRRDPFVSLTTSTDIRPILADLRLTTVALDPTGHNSIAILRDLGTKEQYRVKVGTPLGRMRVVRIDQKSVTFAIEEFGFSRQATLTMSDSTRTRTP